MRQTASDYIDGECAGDVEPMESSLYNQLSKRWITSDRVDTATKWDKFRGLTYVDAVKDGFESISELQFAVLRAAVMRLEPASSLYVSMRVERRIKFFAPAPPPWEGTSR